ncbi:MAG: flagellar hook-length control protein FliK [Gammaproteobacteria bacterium]|nr:flagellar hook-length control protein FliK [Gammaproteobacteria bacterium]
MALPNVDKAEALLTVNSVVGDGVTNSMTTDPKVAFFDRVQALSEANGEARLSVAVRHPEWAAAVGQRVQALLQQQANHIQIRLDPPELGKLDVQIQVNDAGTQVVFHTEQREVKEALERAFPRLHEMLSMENNMSLGFQLGSQNSHGFQQNESGKGSALDSEDDQDVAQATVGQNQLNIALSAIDFYA